MSEMNTRKIDENNRIQSFDQKQSRNSDNQAEKGLLDDQVVESGDQID